MKNFILRNKKGISTKKGKTKNQQEKSSSKRSNSDNKDVKRRNSNSTYTSTTSSRTKHSSSSEKPCKIEKDILPRKKKTFINQLLEIKDGKQKSYLDNLHQEQKSRDPFSNDERVQELKDQNQYLVEKVQFLKLQKSRNESEIVRMDAKQVELRKIHKMCAEQLAHIESLITEWQEFHTKLIRTSEEWSEQTRKIMEKEEMKYENIAPVVVAELL